LASSKLLIRTLIMDSWTFHYVPKHVAPKLVKTTFSCKKEYYPVSPRLHHPKVPIQWVFIQNFFPFTHSVLNGHFMHTYLSFYTNNIYFGISLVHMTIFMVYSVSQMLIQKLLRYANNPWALNLFWSYNIYFKVIKLRSL